MISPGLQEIPVFQDLTTGQIEEVNGWLVRKEFQAGTEIIVEGTWPDGWYVLAKGKVEVIKKTAAGPALISILQGPSVFGEIGILIRETRFSTVRAQTPIITGFISMELFEEKIRTQNLTALRLGFNLGRLAAQRFRWTLRKAMEMIEIPSGQAGPTDMQLGITRLLQSAWEAKRQAP